MLHFVIHGGKTGYVFVVGGGFISRGGCGRGRGDYDDNLRCQEDYLSCHSSVLILHLLKGF